MQIDLNCDMGEFAATVADGTQERLMRSLTSVNIACGGHAGDAQTMRATIEQALRCGVAIGAHPGYADRENFGRVELRISKEEVAESVYEQVCALAKIAEECGARVGHVKPHGALYNQAARDGELARAIARGVARWNRGVVMVGLAGSVMLEVFREEGFLAAAEAFADRRYEGDGSLRSRKFADALISEPEEAAQQALQIVQKGSVIASDGKEVRVAAQTICVHGDTPGAAEIVASIARAFVDAGVELKFLN